MGCGGIARVAEEQQNLLLQLQQAKLEKESVLDDRAALGIEVQQLRAHVAHLVSENEILKQKVDKFVSTGNPEIFEGCKSEDEVIANWIEMDLRDGDNLLEALKGVHPPSVPEIERMLRESGQLRQAESSLQEYCAYFSTRFKLYNEIWRKVVEVHFAMDESFKNIREVLAANMQIVEPMIGKKSAAMDELREEISHLFQLTYADFMKEQRRLETKITGYRIDYYNKRVEEKEAEKQRILARNEADTKALRAKHQAEMDNLTAEMEGMRKAMQEKIDNLTVELQQEFARKEKYAADLRDLHAGNLRKMKAYLRKQLADMASDMRVLMSGFASDQKKMENDLIVFCRDTLGDTMKMMSAYEKQIADLKERHRQEKALMRRVMRKNTEAFKVDFTRIVEQFKDYRRDTEAALLAFCDLTTDKKNQIIRQHEDTIRMLHEDVRAEICKRDRETAALRAFYEKQKATMRSVMKASTLQFRDDFSQLSRDFQAFQKSVEVELRLFCEIKTDQFINHTRDSTFLLDQAHKMYSARISVLKEDMRCEIAKRDRETAALKAFYERQKALMREIMSKQTTDLRREMVTLSDEFQALQKFAEKAISANMHVHHDIHIYDLRAEGIANCQMLIEEHRHEILKRDAERENLVGDYKVRVIDLERQLVATAGELAEDARGQVLKLEERADRKERSRAMEVEEILKDFTTSLDSTFSRAATASSAALSPLSEHQLPIPDRAIIDSTELEPIMGGQRARNGAQFYEQVVTRLKATLAKSREETEKILQADLSHESWLVAQWLKLENTRTELQSQWAEDLVAFRKQVADLQGQLKDFEDHHGFVSSSMNGQITDLKDVIRQHEATIKEREDAIDALKNTVEMRKKDIADRESTIGSQKSALLEKEGEIVRLQHELEEHGANTKKDWDDCQELIEELRETIRVNEEKYNKARTYKVHKRLLTDAVRKLQNLKRSFLIQWRLRVTGFVPQNDAPPIEMDSEESDNDSEMSAVEEFIREEKRIALENNVMVEAFRKAETQEKPLSIPQALKFLEEMMDRKYDTDMGDIKNQRPLRTLPNFFLEYTSRTFGLKKLAVKMLCQILPTLELMNNEGNPYCQLFCRLVQVDHPDPVPFQLAIFLTKVRIEFTPFAEKYQKDKEARDSKRGIKRDVGKGKEKSTSLTGGEAYVLDVIGYVYSLFESDRRSGEAMLKQLQPEGVEMYDYVVFKLCHKMAKLGLNAEGIYGMLDRESTGSISEIEFIRSSRRNLELWISAEDLSLVFKTMSGGARQLTREAFVSRLNFKAYLENCRSDLFIVSRCNFLLSMIEVYHSRQKRDGVFLKGVVGSRKHTPFDVFEGLVKRMDPGLAPAKVQMLYTEAQKLSPDPEQGISVGAFVRVILRHPIGALRNSPFCKRHTDIKELDLEFDALDNAPAAEAKTDSSTSSPSPQPRSLDKKGGAKKAGAK